MSFIGLKTAPRPQRSAGFSIGLKTGDVLELTISGAMPTAVSAPLSTLQTQAALFQSIGHVDNSANPKAHKS